MNFNDLSKTQKKKVISLLNEQGEIYGTTADMLFEYDSPEAIKEIPAEKLWELMVASRQAVYAAHALCINLAGVYEMLGQQDYEYGNLPARLRNEDCCSAYQYALEWVASILPAIEVNDEVSRKLHSAMVMVGRRIQKFNYTVLSHAELMRIKRRYTADLCNANLMPWETMNLAEEHVKVCDELQRRESHAD